MRTATPSLLFLVGGLLLAAGLPASAQNWRPFGPGRTYHYREFGQFGKPDSIYTLRVDSTYTVGTDTAYCFNRTSFFFLGGNRQSAPSTGQPQRRNLFGGTMRWSAATGEAVFTAEGTSASVRLLTRAAIGQSWAFSPTVQATVTARYSAVVLGQYDTVQVVSLSDGHMVQLSRSYGLVSGTSLDYYLGQTYWEPLTRRSLLLDGLPELQLGAPALTHYTLWDWQPGDEYYYRATYTSGITQPGSGSWRSHSRLLITGRQLNPAGDTLRFTGQRRIVTETYLAPYWSGPSRSTLTAAQPTTLTIALTDAVPLTATQSTLGPPHLQLQPIVQQASVFSNRPSVMASFYFEGGVRQQYTLGLGQTYAEHYVDPTVLGGDYHQEDWLVGYVKNGVSWGDTAAIVLGHRSAVATLPATLAPNPATAGAEPILSFTAERTQLVGLTLYDAVGRVVWRQQVRCVAGEQAVSVPTQTLAPGLYRLRLLLADGRQRHLPLLSQ